MGLSVWMDNLVAYSIQIAILAAAGTLLAHIFRLRVPRVSLIYWQALLLVCLLLPALQKWQHPVAPSYTAPPSISINPVPGNVDVAGRESPGQPVSKMFPILQAALVVFIAGFILRTIWLGLGFLRLRLYLRRSEELTEAPPEAGRLSSLIGIHAQFFLCKEIDSPATFGIFTPRILLPGNFHCMNASCREAVICHELLHVRRRDWAWILVEELLRTLFWFHPAVWWLLGRIHLAREQAVDYESVRLTSGRQPYLNSLLEIARMHGHRKAVPAPLFLREHHLVERVSMLVKEVSMNRFRLILSLTGIFVLLAGTMRLAAAWFPLMGAVVIGEAGAPNPPVASLPQQQEPKRIAKQVLESNLVFQVPPVYPELAKRARVTGIVVLEVTINEEGQVQDVKALEGHPFLRDSAIDAVKQWRYRPILMEGKAIPVVGTVTVTFNFDPNPGNDSKTIQQHEALIEATATKLRNSGQDIAFVPNERSLYGIGYHTSDPQKSGFNGATNLEQVVGFGGSFVYRATPVNRGLSPSAEGHTFNIPELDFDKERLYNMARDGWPPGVNTRNPLVFFFLVDENGTITDIRRVQGPDIPGVEEELIRTPVIKPGFYNSNPETFWCVVEIRLPNS